MTNDASQPLASEPSFTFLLQSLEASSSFEQPDTSEEFEKQFQLLSDDCKNAVLNLCGVHFLESLRVAQPGIRDPAEFFSICFILAHQQNLDALIAWVNIPRGHDTIFATISPDKDTIDVTITRRVGFTSNSISNRIKEAGHFFEPYLLLWGSDQSFEQTLSHLKWSPSPSLTLALQSFSQESAISDHESLTSFFSRVPTPPLPYSDHFQPNGNSGAADNPLQRTSSTDTVGNDDPQADLSSNVHRTLSVAPTLGSVGSGLSRSGSSA